MMSTNMRCNTVILFLCVFSSFLFFAEKKGFSQDSKLIIGREGASTRPISKEEEIVASVRSEMLASYQKDIVLRPSIPSLLFLPGEHGLLQAAKLSFLTRLPTTAELDEGEEGAIAIVRNVSLGGILYVGEKEWVIWINSQRITPDALASEIIDLSVFKDYIDIKWFDRQTNRIYPIRLRPNQRFNLDAKMFLPG